MGAALPVSYSKRSSRGFRSGHTHTFNLEIGK